MISKSMKTFVWRVSVIPGGRFFWYRSVSMMTTAQFFSSNLSSQSATPSQRFSKEMQLPFLHPNSDARH